MRLKPSKAPMARVTRGTRQKRIQSRRPKVEEDMVIGSWRSEL